MKKIKFILAITIMLMAQLSKAQSISYGVKAGGNFTEMYGSPATLHHEFSAGFTAGLFARIGDRMYFQPGINYTSYAAKFDLNGVHNDLKFNQLQIPLMLGYKFIAKHNFDFHGAVGPQGDYNIKRPAAVNGFEYSKFNASGRAELGVGFSNFTVDAGYSYNLTAANKGLNQRAGITSLTVGLLF